MDTSSGLGNVHFSWRGEPHFATICPARAFVRAATNASRVGFRPGDIIDEINGTPVRSADQVQSQLNAGAGWTIGLQRGGQHAEIRFGR